MLYVLTTVLKDLATTKEIRMIDTKKVKLAIEQGRIKGAEKLLRTQYIKEHKAKFDEELRNEYSELFPSHRDMSDDEYDAYIIGLGENPPMNISVPSVEIDYSEDESYMAYEEYINETVVVEEATDETEEVVEQVRPYIPMTIEEVEVKVDAYLSPTYSKIAKQKRKDVLASLTVELESIEFDANQTSMVYMNAVGTVAAKHFAKALASGISTEDAYKVVYEDITIDWKDANNVVNPVTVAQVVDVLEETIKAVSDVVIGT